MMTPACPRLLDMINDFVVLRFWARAPRGFKRYRSYIILLLLLLHNGNEEWHVQEKWNSDKIKSENISKGTRNGMVRTSIEDNRNV